MPAGSEKRRTLLQNTPEFVKILKYEFVIPFVSVATNV
jgi:hypothetical protein